MLMVRMAIATIMFLFTVVTALPGAVASGAPRKGRRGGKNEEALDIVITLAGAPSSGKSAVAAALFTSVNMYGLIPWRISPVDDNSDNFMLDSTALFREGEFPVKGGSVDPVTYTFIIDGTVPPRWVQRWYDKTPRKARLRIGIQKRLAQNYGREVAFTVSLRDYPGGQFLIKTSQLTSAEKQAWEEIGKSDVIIFLFDATIEGTNDDNYKYLHRWVSLLLKMRNEAAKKAVRGPLKQRLLVRVAKYDDPEVFSRLQSFEGIVDMNSTVPVVRDPRVAFEFLADEQTKMLIRNNFDPDRVSYEVISACGFYMQPWGGFDPRDYRNVLHSSEGPCLRGSARPINVLESFMEGYRLSVADHAGVAQPVATSAQSVTAGAPYVTDQREAAANAPTMPMSTLAGLQLGNGRTQEPTWPTGPSK
ncbi:MAG TPA: hypothetical protein VJ183_05345 [Chloroflexia bacterium]|nr:hypothetical protein [Chloroflexia bacterium]